MALEIPSAADIRAIVQELLQLHVAPLREEIERLRKMVGEETVPLAEAAKLLGTTTRTLQRRIKANELPAVKGSKGFRIPRSALVPNHEH